MGESDAAYCARPDCPSAETVEYFIDRIIGRRPSQTQPPSSNGLPKFLFLVRWQGCVCPSYLSFIWVRRLSASPW